MSNLSVIDDSPSLKFSSPFQCPEFYAADSHILLSTLRTPLEESLKFVTQIIRALLTTNTNMNFLSIQENSLETVSIQSFSLLIRIQASTKIARETMQSMKMSCLLLDQPL